MKRMKPLAKKHLKNDRSNRRGSTIVVVIALLSSLMILVAPPALLISLWFNTLIPGLALVAVFAVLACYLKPDHQMLLLPVFVPLTLMAYTTYPLLLLAICLTTAGARRTPGDLIGLVVLFVGSFAFGIALIYGLNLLEHGVFGIPMADWRNPSPAHDLTSLIQNLGLVWSFLAEAASALSFEFTPAAIVHGLLFCGATLVLWASC